MFDLLQIGELSKECLSKEAFLSLSEIPWSNMYGLRNRIVHGYASVDYKIIWDTIDKDIPKLIKTINNYVNKK